MFEVRVWTIAECGCTISVEDNIEAESVDEALEIFMYEIEECAEITDGLRLAIAEEIDSGNWEMRDNHIVIEVDDADVQRLS